MAGKIKIAAFSGSARKGSLNKKLLAQAVRAAEAAGAEVQVVDLAALGLPVYDGDLEAAHGLPPAALAFKDILRGSDGFLIASPEHNSGYSALLKNAIDWASRPATADELSLAAFTGKYAALMAASPGALGGLRGLYALRELLQNINVTVLPGMQAVGAGHTAFDDDGALRDEKTAANIRRIAQSLVQTLDRMRA